MDEAILFLLVACHALLARSLTSSVSSTEANCAGNVLHSICHKPKVEWEEGNYRFRQWSSAQTAETDIASFKNLL